MLKWVSNLLGGPSAEVPEGVPKAWVEQLELALRPLGKELSRDTLAFVLHGEPMAVLAALAWAFAPRCSRACRRPAAPARD